MLHLIYKTCLSPYRVPLIFTGSNNYKTEAKAIGNNIIFVMMKHYLGNGKYEGLQENYE